MAKKSQNKDDSTSFEHTGSETIPSDEFSVAQLGSSFEMIRKRQNPFFDVSRSKEEHQMMLRESINHRDELQHCIEQRVQELEAILLQFDPFDVIANISFSNANRDAEASKGYSQEDIDAYTEYVTLLYLTKPYEAFSGHSIEPIPGEMIQNIWERVHALFTQTVVYLAMEGIDQEQLNSPASITQLRFDMLLRSIIVRYPGYHQHLIDILTSLFTPLQEELENTLGFNIRDALTLIEGIEPLAVTLTFTSQDLANATRIDIRRVRSFLERMSLKFGDVDPRYYQIPSPTHPLMTKPLIERENQYFCPVKELVYWSLRPSIEAYLNPRDPGTINKDKALWERYNRIRANYVEEQAIEYLGRALRTTQAYHNLKYRIYQDGELRESELDGLIMVDSALFLVEAKAGSLSLPARRGAPKRIVREIKELVGKPFLQALRAKQFIQEVDRPTFFLANGAAVEIPKGTFDHIFLVIVTLDSLDAFVTHVSQLQDSGLLAEDDFPWIVSLPDLRVISELPKFSGQLVDYLMSRSRINVAGLLGSYDELDCFGHYLHESLRFDDILAEKDTAYISQQEEIL